MDVNKEDQFLNSLSLQRIRGTRAIWRHPDHDFHEKSVATWGTGQSRSHEAKDDRFVSLSGTGSDKRPMPPTSQLNEGTSSIWNLRCIQEGTQSGLAWPRIVKYIPIDRDAPRLRPGWCQGSPAASLPRSPFYFLFYSEYEFRRWLSQDTKNRL